LSVGNSVIAKQRIRQTQSPALCLPGVYVCVRPIVNCTAHVLLCFFIARCYASAVFAVIMCPTVRLSVRRLPSTYPPLCCKEIRVSPKIKVLGFGTLSRTSDLENFATASRSRCQQHSSSSSTVELVGDTFTTVDESWLFTTSRSTATL